MSSTTFLGPALVDLGSLDVGAEGKVLIQIENDLESGFRTESADTTCGCIRARTTSELVAPGEVLPLEVSISVPKTAKDAKVIYPVRLEGGAGEMAIQVLLQFTYRGIVSFRTRNIDFAFSREVSDWKYQIPLLITPPVEAQDLSFRASPELGPHEFQVKQEGDVYLVECQTRTRKQESGRVGVLWVQDRRSGLENQIDVYLNRVDEVTIAPKLLRLVGGSGRYEGHVLCRVDEHLFLAKTGEKPNFDALGIKGVFNEARAGWKLGVEAEHVRSGSYRLNFRAVRDEGRPAGGETEFPKSVALEVVTPDKAISANLSCVFLEEPIR